MKNKQTWKMVIQLLVSILTAIATTLGVTSCMALGCFTLRSRRSSRCPRDAILRGRLYQVCNVTKVTNHQSEVTPRSLTKTSGGHFDRKHQDWFLFLE